MGKPTFFVVLTLAALAVFAGLTIYLRSTERRALREAALLAAAPAEPGAPPANVRILGLLRAANLITVELTSIVSSRQSDQSWRGDVEAAVSAPVLYHYGVDLGALPDDALKFDPLRGGYTLTLPEPRRIATEVFGQDEDTFVSVGWGRFRSRAGEYYLGQARRRLYIAARDAPLSDADLQRVNELTREQLSAVVRRLAGERAGAAPVPINIEFTRALTDAGVPR